MELLRKNSVFFSFTVLCMALAGCEEYAETTNTTDITVASSSQPSLHPMIDTTTYSVNCTSDNGTFKPYTAGKSFYDKVVENKEMVVRMVIVISVLTGLVIVYFIVKTIRTRRRTRSKRYGLIADNMELAHLDPSDDEDNTVFQMNNKNS